MAKSLRPSWWTTRSCKTPGTLAGALQVFLEPVQLDALGRSGTKPWARECRIAAMRLQRYFEQGLRVYNFDGSPRCWHFDPSGIMAQEPVWHALIESRLSGGFGSIMRWNSMFFALAFPRATDDWALQLARSKCDRVGACTGKCLCGMLFHECIVGMCGLCKLMFCKRCLIFHRKCTQRTCAVAVAADAWTSQQ